MPAHFSLLADASTIPLLVSVGILLLALFFCIGRMLWYRKWFKSLGSSASQLAKGDLSTPIPSIGPTPAKALADTLNQMARQLDDRLSQVVGQRNEQGTILASMHEGVIAVDDQVRIFSINRAATVMLGLDMSDILDRPINETLRHPELRKYLTQTLDSGQGMQGEITFKRPIPKETNPHTANAAIQSVSPDDDVEPTIIIEAQSALLRDAAGMRMGAVLVLHDVTQLRHLESVRQDFVANVSHEIRTPVSAVKAAAETLLDEFDEDDHNASPDRQTLVNFLGIIARQSNQLHAIVDDLLSLTRLEQVNRNQAIELNALPASTVIASAIETCHAKATKAKIAVRTRCETGLIVQINRLMIEQALVNLIDNAIKYSPAGTQVEVRARQLGSEIEIAVIDQGRGIDPEHLPRLFERFYRTDKARNRDHGGTGLGLSIVKHIAQAHNGRVHVESRPGMGSTFTIVLPHSL